MSSKKPPLPSKKPVSQEKYRSFTEKKSALKEAEIAETLEEIKITTVHAGAGTEGANAYGYPGCLYGGNSGSLSHSCKMAHVYLLINER